MRGERQPGHLRSVMRRGTQACLFRLALTHFKQTQAEIVARHRIVRPQSERTPKEIGGSGVVAVQSHHLGQWSQNIGPPRRRRKRCTNIVRALVRSLRLR